jgi:hypothetical protein
MASSPRKAPGKAPVFAPKVQTAPAPALAAAQVDFVRPELTDRLGQYQLIRDCIAGDQAVKKAGIKYLPMPMAHDTSKENRERYEAYKTRAVFYNVGERTLAGLVGQVFNVDPIIEVPELLNPVVKDAGGDGVPLVQQAQSCHELVTQFGRAGLLVDFPKTTGATTRAQQLSGEVRPTIHLYHPENIINWRTTKRGSKTLLSLVVLRETYEKTDTDDGFAVEHDTQYRVLRLVNGLYEMQVWRKGATDAAFAPDPELGAMPVDAKGRRLTEIPFTFVGSVDNTPKMANPPMYALCSLNIAHYRNSADYEETVYITGQSTPVITGLTQHWLDEVLKGVIELGSRAAITLPENATASLLQMEERTAAFAAMEHKERQMVALGAKLVEQKQVQRTATEAGLEEASETSVLGTITDNVSAAYLFALEWCGIFQGVISERQDSFNRTNDDAPIKFELNTDFSISLVSSEEVKTAVETWQKDAITFTEMRATIKKAKLGYLDDEKAKQEILAYNMDMGEKLGHNDTDDTDNNAGGGNDDRA